MRYVTYSVAIADARRGSKSPAAETRTTRAPATSQTYLTLRPATAIQRELTALIQPDSGYYPALCDTATGPDWRHYRN